jgi:uncharacterized protein (TIGR02300 family)
VAKPEWGVKRTCLNCGARFYDLQREPIVCPACGAIVDAAVQSKPRRARATPAMKVAAVPAAAVVELEAAVVEDEADLDTGLEEEEEVEEDEEVEEVAESEAAEDESEEEGESAIEDVSELGDDDMTDVIDTEIDEEETDR